MPVTSRSLRLALYTVLILIGAVLAGTWAMRQAQQHALLDSAKRGPEQLSLYANSLHTLIERYRALPAPQTFTAQANSGKTLHIEDATSQTLLSGPSHIVSHLTMTLGP